MYDFLDDAGEWLGILIIIFYSLTILNFILKFINKKFRHQINKNETLKTNYRKFMRFIVKNHRYFGFLAITFVLLHFAVQYSIYGLSITGITAAAIMALQIVLGIYGQKVKRPGKIWLALHRTIAVLLLIAIVLHVD